ncbi:hypothetical protein HDV00_002343 [Rhizophlyctis rosea]|nr:hypothetical protein HDV00_002343 [Rhizophlyctis rosea]
MAVLRNCCCCFSLRTGVLILTGWSLLGGILSLFGTTITALLSKHSDVNIPSSPGLFTLLDLILVGFGFFGAWKNNVKHVKVFAIYQWIRVAFGALFSAVIMAVAAFGRQPLIDNCNEKNREAPADEQVDCAALINTFAGIIIGVLLINALVSIYFGFAVWSFYQDLRDHPEKYGGEAYVYLAIPVGGEAPAPLLDNESALPAYDEATGSSSVGPQPTGIPGLPDAPNPKGRK